MTLKPKWQSGEQRASIARSAAYDKQVRRTRGQYCFHTPRRHALHRLDDYAFAWRGHFSTVCTSSSNMSVRLIRFAWRGFYRWLALPKHTVVAAKRSVRVSQGVLCDRKAFHKQFGPQLCDFGDGPDTRTYIQVRTTTCIRTGPLHLI